MARPSILASCHSDRTHHANGYCKQCYHKFYMRERRSKGLAWKSDTQKWRHLLMRYNLTQEQYPAMLTAQAHKCYICGRDNKRLVIDHDHNTNVVRGLLCDMCNHAIGYLEGWIEEVGAAKFVNYLNQAVNI